MIPISTGVRVWLASGAALIAHLKLQIEKLRREFYGARSKRTERLLNQMEHELEELEAAACETITSRSPPSASRRAASPGRSSWL